MEISASTQLAVVVGHPVIHSRSPALHNAAFRHLGIDAVYLALDCSPEGLPALVAGLKAVPILGASVTVPHKAAVMELCDELSPAAAAIGAVNTLQFSAGRTIGHNTDAPGYVQAFADAGFGSLAGRNVVLLGGGGAAKAVAYGVKEAAAQSVQVIARSPSKVGWCKAQPWSPEVLERVCRQCDVLVDCTSTGLSLKGEGALPAPIPVAALPSHAVVSSLVYHRKPALLDLAESHGLATVDGAGMLLYQGAIAFSLWTGKQAPIEVMHRALSPDTAP